MGIIRDCRVGPDRSVNRARSCPLTAALGMHFIVSLPEESHRTSQLSHLTFLVHSRSLFSRSSRRIVRPDALVAWVAQSDARVYATDRFIFNKTTEGIALDDKQDWHVLGGSQTTNQSTGDTWTTVHVWRQLDTGDCNDRPIVPGKLHNVIWAMGATTDVSYHSSDRGASALVLAPAPGPSIIAPAPPPSASSSASAASLAAPQQAGKQPAQQQQGESMLNFTFTNYRLPTDFTTYRCKAFQFLLIPKEYGNLKGAGADFDCLHDTPCATTVAVWAVFSYTPCALLLPLSCPLTARSTAISREQGRTLIACTTTSRIWSNHSPPLPPTLPPHSKEYGNLKGAGADFDCLHDTPCATTVAVWAVGGRPFTFPPNVGYPIGPGHFTKFVLQVHFTNPKARADLIGSSGLQLKLAPSLRPMDASIMLSGHVHFTNPKGRADLIDNSGLYLKLAPSLRPMDASIMLSGPVPYEYLIRIPPPHVLLPVPYPSSSGAFHQPQGSRRPDRQLGAVPEARPVPPPHGRVHHALGPRALRGRADLIDNSGLYLKLAPSLRPMDASIMLSGPVPYEYLIRIPPPMSSSPCLTLPPQVHFTNPKGRADLIDNSGLYLKLAPPPHGRVHHALGPRALRGRADLIDNSGLYLKLAPSLRPMDASIMLSGPVPYEYLIKIPPGMPSWTQVSTCPGECTAAVFNNESVKIIGSFLHLHTLGRQIIGSFLHLHTLGRQVRDMGGRGRVMVTVWPRGMPSWTQVSTCPGECTSNVFKNESGSFLHLHTLGRQVRDMGGRGMAV
ncbi:unnamed protein product [Closterium sp. Naga37s-1]|nr:unnamed protein product [Closterium sp. Naga37s-1]